MNVGLEASALPEGLVSRKRKAASRNTIHVYRRKPRTLFSGCLDPGHNLCGSVTTGNGSRGSGQCL